MPISHTAHVTLDEPSDEIDIEAWLFALSDGDYQACARGHRGAGVFSDEQGRGMINVESIGGNLIVQHYRPCPRRPLLRRDVLTRKPGVPLPCRSGRRRRALDTRGDTEDRHGLGPRMHRPGRSPTRPRSAGPTQPPRPLPRPPRGRGGSGLRRRHPPQTPARAETRMAASEAGAGWSIRSPPTSSSPSHTSSSSGTGRRTRSRGGRRWPTVS